MYLLLLSQDNLEIAKYEAISLLELSNIKSSNIELSNIENKNDNKNKYDNKNKLNNDKTNDDNTIIKKHNIIKNIMICNIKKNIANKINRLAFTKKAYEILFVSNIDDLGEALYSYNFSWFYKKNFSLRTHKVIVNDKEVVKEKEEYKIVKDKKVHNKENSDSVTESILKESEYASFVWKSLVREGIKPKVDLTTPETCIEIFFIMNHAFVCRKIWENNENFEARKAHLRRIVIPTAMMPKMARALVNILNKNKVVDPFCGTGGIILEACLMGLKCEGYDIDEKILGFAKENLMKEKISEKNYSLKQYDATKLKNLKNVVTDLPYGKSSKKTDELVKLYSSFIRNLKGRAVIVFPHFVDYEKILVDNLNSDLEIKKIISHYVHKSLIRKIVVIDKKYR